MSQDRLLMQHRAIFLASGGKLLYAPIPESPQHVLDLGTGIGNWAIDMADKHSETQVLTLI